MKKKEKKLSFFSCDFKGYLYWFSKLNKFGAIQRRLQMGEYSLKMKEWKTTLNLRVILS